MQPRVLPAVLKVGQTEISIVDSTIASKIGDE